MLKIRLTTHRLSVSSPVCRVSIILPDRSQHDAVRSADGGSERVHPSLDDPALRHAPHGAWVPSSRRRMSNGRERKAIPHRERETSSVDFIPLLCEEGNPAALTFPRRSAGYPLQGIPDCPNWDIWLLFPRSTESLPDRQIYPASAIREYGSA